MTAAEHLAAIRRAVERACALLADASPPALDRSTEALEGALRELADLRAGLAPGSGGPAERAEAERLRRTIGCAARLLGAAAGFFAGWNRRLGELMAGYTVRGDAAPPLRPGHLSLQG